MIELHKYEPIQVATTHLVDAYWPLAEPLFKRCIDKAMHGECHVEHFKEMVLQRAASLIVIANDSTGTHPERDVKLALLVEPVAHPNLPAINILAIGGRDLSMLKREYWDQFKGWAYMNGARAIEAYVQPGMQRIIQRWDFKPAYTVMRCSLTETKA